MGRGWGLFLYLSKINYDGMINCERWKDKLRVILCIIKRNYASEKMTTKHIIVTSCVRFNHLRDNIKYNIYIYSS